MILNRATCKHRHMFGKLAKCVISMAESASLDQTEASQNSGSAQLSMPYVTRICPEDITTDFLARTLSITLVIMEG